jgi:phospholipid/cholesterol/gamma-HCH transport system substrate-binding protein
MRVPKPVGRLVGVLVIAALVVAGYVYVSRQPAPHDMTIHYPTAAGLVPGSDVFEAGAKVGSVSDIVPDSGNGVFVSIKVDDSHWPLHQGVSADIRPKSLLGEKYVDLHDSNSSAQYDPSKTLEAPADSTPVELDQFLNSLDAPSRSAIKVLLNDLGAGVAGQGASLNSAVQTARQDLDHLDVTGQTLDNRDRDLDRIIVGLDGVLQKLTTSDQLQQISQLISNGQTVLDAVEAEKDSFSRQFVDAQKALTELNTVLGPTVASLRDTLQTAPALLTSLRTESDLLAEMGKSVTTPPILDLLNGSLVHGPTVLRGATEFGVPGHTGGVGITRVCLKDPDTSGPSNSCDGDGFHPPAGSTTNPTTAAWSGSSGDSTGGAVDLQRLVGFIGA